MTQPISIAWLRRDLRLDDNAGLFHALTSGHAALPVFIFDTNILEALSDRGDKRVNFTYRALEHLHDRLVKMGSTLYVLHGTPIDCFKELAATYDIAAVYTNHDYEPYALQRDAAVKDFLHSRGILFYSFKDQVIFEKDEVVKENNEPYTVYTPYSRRWKEKLAAGHTEPYPCEKNFHNLLKSAPRALPPLASIGFNTTVSGPAPAVLNEAIAARYDKTRDYPALNGTTRLSVHLRFGTISIRWLVMKAMALNATLLNELIWREFYQMILWHFPAVVNTSFKKEYDNIQWRNNEREFELWRRGETGYPIVDAGMRELNTTGYMHNRVRMITASFLTKDLLADWRWGEAYFAEKLMDYDLAANNGGWQWAAGSGCDAAPYFRIFNPELQTLKFDPELAYIRRWVPEFSELNYAPKLVDHKAARERCLLAYKKALSPH